MRQLAWFAATPRPPHAKPSDPAPMSRIEQWRADDRMIPMPPLSDGTLVMLLQEIGPTVPGPMGAVPIGWQDIAAWQACTGEQLDPWDARKLRELSMQYLTELHLAEQPERPMPGITQEQVVANRDAVSRKLKAMFAQVQDSIDDE